MHQGLHKLKFLPRKPCADFKDLHFQVVHRLAVICQLGFDPFSPKTMKTNSEVHSTVSFASSSPQNKNYSSMWTQVLLQCPSAVLCVVQAIWFMTVQIRCVENQRARVMYRHHTDQMIPQTQPRYTNPEGGGCKLVDWKRWGVQRHHLQSHRTVEHRGWWWEHRNEAEARSKNGHGPIWTSRSYLWTIMYKYMTRSQYGFLCFSFPPNINTTLACVVRAICFMTVYRLDVWNQRAQVMYRHYADQLIPQTQPRYTNPEGGGCKLDDWKRWGVQRHQKRIENRPAGVKNSPRRKSIWRHQSADCSNTFFWFNAKVFRPLSTCLCNVDWGRCKQPLPAHFTEIGSSEFNW
jgi:hypothetical protein